MVDLEKLMKLDLSYPGISFGYYSWSLGIYLDSSSTVGKLNLL